MPPGVIITSIIIVWNLSPCCADGTCVKFSSPLLEEVVSGVPRYIAEGDQVTSLIQVRSRRPHPLNCLWQGSPRLIPEKSCKSCHPKDFYRHTRPVIMVAPLFCDS